MLYNQLKKIKKAGTVVRFHTNEMINRQTNGEHQHSCGLMAYTIASNITGLNSELCALYMMTHDLGEKRYGDMPGHIKEMYPEIEAAERECIKELYPQFEGIGYDKLNADERHVCYFCDKFDCLITSGNEVRKGNRELEYCFERTLVICVYLAYRFHHNALRDIISDYMRDNDDIIKNVFGENGLSDAVDKYITEKDKEKFAA